MTIGTKQIKQAVLNTQKEFNCVLDQGTQLKSSYFVLHYYIENLSTKTDQQECVFVDKFLSDESKLGLIIPKRFAKRAVTRTLIKRQCRIQFSFFIREFPKGYWIIRLKRPIDSTRWKSSSSDELKRFIRLELQSLFSKAAMHLGISYHLC